MRDALLLLVVLMSMLVVLRYPFAGLIVWAWFTIMTPHMLTFGTFGVPVNLVIAAVTMISIVINGALTSFRPDWTTFFLIVFGIWLVVAQKFSLDPEHSMVFTDRFVKTIVFVVLCTQMANSRLRIHALVWVLVLGIGFFALKGSLFTLATLGQYRVQGLPLSILEDNNHMGITMATVLPLILFLRSQTQHRHVRLGLSILFAMTILAIIGTFSRGAFLSMVAFGGFFWLRSKHKFTILAVLIMLTAPAIAFMPSKWTDRMTTITDATEDDSFMGRVDAWVINTKLAIENPVTGAGLRNSYNPKIAERVDPERAARAKAAHSIYFEVLGGTGFVGLAVFMSIIGSAILATLTLQRKTYTEHGVEPWIPTFAYYAQMSIVVFCVGGASTSLEMWDGYLLVIALIAAAGRMANEPARRNYTLPERTRWRVQARGRAVSS